MPFAKGNKHGVPRRKGEAVVPPLLLDYRHVYGKPERKNESAGRKILRQMMLKDPKGFMAAYQRLEEKHAVTRAAALAKRHAELPGGEEAKEVGEAPLVDEGQVRVTDLIDQLIKEFKDGNVVEG